VALLTNVQQIGFGTLMVPAPVSASDTFVADPGGLILEVINAGASPDTVAVVDPGTTPAGTGALAGGPSQSVAAATRREFKIGPQFANSSGVITVTHSFTTSVTYNLKRA
jgi:hypothetical protein